MTYYMSSCANATAAFSVLSDTIRHVQATFASTRHNRNDLVQFLAHLQRHEKEKLNLTAALHLEQIRERNENINLLEQNGDNKGVDKRISQLLHQGVQSLQQKLAACVEDINEAIEEIRYALLEEQGDDNE